MADVLTWEPSRYSTANHYPGKGIDRRTEAVKRDFRIKSSLSDPRIAKFLITYKSIWLVKLMHWKHGLRQENDPGF